VALAIAYGHLSLVAAILGFGLALLPASPARAGAILALSPSSRSSDCSSR
jgi:hypothetical protein